MGSHKGIGSLLPSLCYVTQCSMTQYSYENRFDIRYPIHKYLLNTLKNKCHLWTIHFYKMSHKFDSNHCNLDVIKN